jgi:uncharacterized protein (TIGR00255 family)
LTHSMTGFATSEISVGNFTLVWEIRSVNHRYLDAGFRLPEDFRGLEPELRKRAGAAVKRGKVDCTLKVTKSGSDQANAEIDTDQLDALRKLEARLRKAWPDAAGLSAQEILRWPGVLQAKESHGEELAEPALAAFDEAIGLLGDARQREGERLNEMLTERLDAIDTLLESIAEQLQQAAPRSRDRLLERLERLDVEANPERLEQELALIAQRTDVSEEADRLKAHLAEIRDVLAAAEPVGRRLDFLIQELNREANTMASKVQDDELARRAVDLKVLIEQMREQAQNIE